MSVQVVGRPSAERTVVVMIVVVVCIIGIHRIFFDTAFGRSFQYRSLFSFTGLKCFKKKERANEE